MIVSEDKIVGKETAKMLKICGFNISTEHSYCETDDIAREKAWIGLEGTMPAPTLYHLQKWLRDKKEIDIVITISIIGGKKRYYGHYVRYNEDMRSYVDGCGDSQDYEECLGDVLFAAVSWLHSQVN